MRVTTVGSFLGAAVLAGIVLSMPAVSDAQTSPTPPTSCTLTIGTATVTVQSAPDFATPVAFPESVDCPAPLAGDCLRWRYRFTHNGGLNLAATGATLTSDTPGAVATTGTPPSDSGVGSAVSNPGDGDLQLGGFGRNVFDVRVARFASGAPIVLANVYTPTNVNMGKVTAVGKVGNALGFCAIAGPANFTPPGPGKVALTTNVIDVAGQCIISRLVDGNGCTVSITNLPGSAEGCQVSTVDATSTLNTTGETLSGLSCNTQITFGQNSSYCYASTFGRLVCVQSPTQ